MALGSGDFTFRRVDGWAKIPLWWQLKACSDVCTDSEDRVFLVDRGAHPVVVFDRDGNFLSCWGEGVFSWNVHGIYITEDDRVYVTDANRHCIRRFTLSGQLDQTIGNPDNPGVTHFGRPFNMPTGIVLAPDGFLYISDGYGNARVHKFTREGEHVKTWGGYGTDPGRFTLVHNIGVDSQNRLYVCDRENDRIQVFDGEGNLLSVWEGLRRPGDVCVRDDTVYVIEQGSPAGPPRVSIFNTGGEMLASWDDAHPEAPGCLNGGHGIWVDSQGDIYVACIGQNPRLEKFARA